MRANQRAKTKRVRTIVWCDTITQRVGVVRLDVGGELNLPAVAVEQQLLLVVEKLLASLRRILEVGPFDNRVHWARILAEATEDALSHVDVVARRAARAVRARLSIDCDRLQRTIVRILYSI